MLRRIMLVPNFLLLACGVFLFHQSFLSGHLTRIGLLFVLSPTLPLWHCCCGKTWTPLKIAAVLMNAALFLMCGYAFCGTSYILFRHGIINPAVYPVVGVLWISALCAGVLKEGTWLAAAGWVFNIALSLSAAAGLYFRTASKWAVGMNIVLFATIMAVTALNVRLFLTAPKQTERIS